MCPFYRAIVAPFIYFSMSLICGTTKRMTVDNPTLSSMFVEKDTRLPHGNPLVTSFFEVALLFTCCCQCQPQNIGTTQYYTF